MVIFISKRLKSTHGIPRTITILLYILLTFHLLIGYEPTRVGVGRWAWRTILAKIHGLNFKLLKYI